MNAAESTTRKSAGPIRSASSFVVGIFTRNLVSKIAAMALAVLVWITVRQDLTQPASLEARVITELAANLMLLENPPDTVMLDLTGPTSEIDQLRRNPEDVKVVLRVTAEDLGDDLEDTRTFSLDRGNIEHSFGEHVRITQLQVGSIQLKVAVRGEERKPVGTPTIVGLPAEWEARIELLNPEVRLTGPKAELDRITSISTAPIRAGPIIDAAEGDNYTTPPFELKLTEETLRKRVELFDEDRMECQVTITRSLAEQEFVVPFTVFIEDPGWPVVPEIHETQMVKRNEKGGFSIRLMLKGSPTDLTRVREALLAGRVRAYVRAMDLSSYAKKAEGRENANVHLELPMEFWDRVSLIPPPREDIDLGVLKREQNPEENE